jgi:hypothetical protein
MTRAYDPILEGQTTLPFEYDAKNNTFNSNIRECVRIARLAKNNSAQVDKIIDTFAKYGTTDMAVGTCKNYST